MTDNDRDDNEAPIEEIEIEGSDDDSSPQHYDPNRPIEEIEIEATDGNTPQYYDPNRPIEEVEIEGYNPFPNIIPRRIPSPQYYDPNRPIENVVIRNQNIVRRNRVLRLSNFDKSRLYPEIVKYLGELQESGYSIRQIEELVETDYTTTYLLNQAHIVINDNKFQQSKNRLFFVFFALYTCEDFNDLINRLGNRFQDDRDDIIRGAERLQQELFNTTRIDLGQYWFEKGLEEIEALLSEVYAESEEEDFEEEEDDSYEEDYDDVESEIDDDTIVIEEDEEFEEKSEQFKEEETEIEIKEPTVLVSNDKSKEEEQEEWEENLSQALDKYIAEINYSIDFKAIALRMYHDILSLLEDNQSYFPFENFLLEFRVKKPNYIALGLFFLTLRMQSINISQEDFAKKVGVSVNILRETIPHFYKFLKKMEGYEFVFDLIRSHLLSETEYKKAVSYYIKLCFDYLDDIDLFNFDFSNNDKQCTYQLLISSINKFSGNNKYKSFYDRLKIKTPRIVAFALCLICINYDRDVDLEQNKFVKLLCDNERLCVNYSKFSEIYGQIIINFFHLDVKKYRNKVKTYLDTYIDDLKRYIIKNSDFQEDVDYILEKIEKKKFTIKSMELYDSIIESGFEINFISKSNEINYYFPQIFALSLICYRLRLTEGIESLGSAEKFQNIYQYDLNYRYITENANRIYPFVKEIIGRYKGQIYSRREFIELLNHSLEEFFHYETFFLLNLFEATQFNPQEFAKEIGYRGGRLYDLIEVTKNHINFIAPDTFSKIAHFIKKYIPQRSKNNFFSDLAKLKKTRQRQFIQESVRYDFRFIEDHIENIGDSGLRIGLKKYFNKILSGDLPDAFFDTKSNPRASKLHLKGISEEQLKTYDIERYLIDVLRQDGEITEYNENFYLCRLTQEIFKFYEKRFGSIPHHNPILNFILMNHENSIAIETPTWKEINNLKIAYTGHIDLISKHDDSLRIDDYKPDKTELLKSIPQICLYGLMVKYILEDITKDNIKLKCRIFCKDYAIEFLPEILGTYVLDFIKYMNSVRKVNLVDKAGNDIQKVIEDFFV